MRALPALILVCFALHTRADGPPEIAPPGAFHDEEHEQIFAAYQARLKELEQANQTRLEAIEQSLATTLALRLLEMAQTTPAERLRELRTTSRRWFAPRGKLEIGAEIPPELAPLVAAYRSSLELNAAAHTEARASAGDDLIRRLDAYAVSFEKRPEGKKTTIALREEIRKLLPRSGPTRTFGELEVAKREWRFGDPWCTRMNFHGDELITLNRVRGLFAGGGEFIELGLWDDGLTPALLAQSMQRTVSGMAYALRHPQLDMRHWKFRFVHFNSQNPTAKLVHHTRGFAFLCGVSGNYSEDTHSYVALDRDDGFYHARLDTDRNDAGARALVIEFPEGSNPGFEFSTAEWRRGDPTVELIPASAGVCFLSGVSGALRSQHEELSLTVGSDGIWRLGGASKRNNTAARALVLKFKK